MANSKRKLLDLTGQIFGRWTVLKEVEQRRSGSQFQRCFLCRCECETEAVIRYANLRNGTSRSCGCLKSEMARMAHTTHGQYGKGIYKVWINMRQRCMNPNRPDYKHYGGRGIQICERWNDYLLFCEDMGERPSPKHTLERKENNENYCPENCVWATQKEQNNNTRVTRHLTVQGEIKTLTEWAAITGLPKTTLKSRLHRGWSDERTVTTPLMLPRT